MSKWRTVPKYVGNSVRSVCAPLKFSDSDKIDIALEIFRLINFFTSHAQYVQLEWQ